jgi:hypothetical protein
LAYNSDVRSPLHTVVETPEFLSRAKRLLTDAERLALVDHLAANPTAGDLMEGTGGARKVRWGARGKGKRGGARVISFYGGPGLPVFLLTLFGKGERANLSKAERNALRRLLADLVEVYRNGKGKHVEGG